MKVAVVVQRYGEAINGGAELHARYIAEHLARHAQVEVLTTCASDYVSWRNELPQGVESINGVAVRRFPVAHERDPRRFSSLSDEVFNTTHSIADELAWLDAEGPTSKALVRHLEAHSGDFDYCVFFSYRYYHAYHGVRAAASRAILVPTAERDAAVGISLFGPIFRGVSALMYNSPEERAMIQAASHNQDVPSVVVGVGSNVPESPQPSRFRQTFSLHEPFAIYVGRIDANKGCAELFEHFQAYSNAGGQLSLVLIGHSLLPVPSHPRIRHLGFVQERDKYDAMAAAEVLVMPSYFESLSMVALEAWGLGRPVLANAKCDVLKGQCLRSNAGLFYDSEAEFIETLRAFERNRWLAGLLGRNGRRFFREHYDWNVIERKYLDMFERLRSSPAVTIEPLPGWLDRRKATCRPSAAVVAELPAGPVVSAQGGPGVSAYVEEPDDARESRRASPTPRREGRRDESSRHHRRARPHRFGRRP
ncbi:MAG: glycosyltransferase family 4 protein [Vicinamibacterales bacterium]